MRGKVLIADDDPKLRDMLRFILDGQKIDTIFCDNGRDVLKTIRNEPVRLILMDVLMPKLNGIETIRKIKSTDGQIKIPIVLMTGVFDEIALKKQLKGIMDDFDVLFKPLSLDKIENVLEKHFGQPHKVSYIFPESFNHKPSMRKRIDTASFNPSLPGADRLYKFYFPMKGSLEEYSPGQLMLYLEDSSGKMEIEFSDDGFDGKLLIENGNITHFCSSDPHVQEDVGWTKKVALKIGQIAGADNVEPHPWISGYRAKPITRFLFKLIFMQKGNYSLSAGNYHQDYWIETEPFPLRELVKGILSGPYSEASTKKVFPRMTIPICLNDFIRSAPGALDLQESQRKLLRLCEQNKYLKDAVNQCELSESKALDFLTGLALIGAVRVEKVCKVQEESLGTVLAAVVEKPCVQRDAVISDDKLTHDDRMEILYEYAKSANYYGLLGIERGSVSEAINASIQNLKDYLELELNDVRISKGAESQRRVCALSLEEASVILLKMSNKRLYDQMDLETSWGAKKKYAIKYHELAKTDSMEGPSIKSIAEYKIAWRLDSSNCDILEEMLDLLIQLSDGIPLVYDFVRDGIRRWPDNMKLRLISGQYYLKVSKPDRAIREFKTVLEKEPENLEAMQYLLEFPDEAKEIFGL